MRGGKGRGRKGREGKGREEKGREGGKGGEREGGGKGPSPSPEKKSWRRHCLWKFFTLIFAVLLVGANFYMRPEYSTVAISDIKFNCPPLIVPR